MYVCSFSCVCEFSPSETGGQTNVPFDYLTKPPSIFNENTQLSGKTADPPPSLQSNYHFSIFILLTLAGE